MARIEIATEVTDDLLDAMERLIPQLSRSNPPPDREAVAEIVASEAAVLFLARDETSGAIIGMLTLVLFRIPTGQRAWIEDVVVDEAAGGRGVGRELNLAALDHARDAGVTTVDLTSRPSRERANRLYRRIGFEQRETNVYRYTL